MLMFELKMRTLMNGYVNTCSPLQGTRYLNSLMFILDSSPVLYLLPRFIVSIKGKFSFIEQEYYWK